MLDPVFIFDLDATLTPPLRPMDAGFARYFRGFAADNPSYIVSGGSFARIERQVPQHILETCAGVFAHDGAEFASGGDIVYSKHHEFHPLIRLASETFIDTSWFPLRRGRHVEEGPGMLLVFAIGANACEAERRRYRDWDIGAGERAHFARSINRSGLGYLAAPWGDIAVRITPFGWDRAVVCDEVIRRHPGAPLHLFADRAGPGSQIEPLAAALAAAGQAKGTTAVSAYNDTWSQLVRLQGMRPRLAAGQSAA
jgi:hypothetical protein